MFPKILICHLLRYYYRLKYRNKKINLPMLEVWVGKSCTMKCKYCCHLIPYIKAEFFPVNDLILDCEKILLISNIGYFSIVGGEPFTNKDLYKLLDYIAEKKEIKNGKIVTNGTVIPDERTTRSLIALNNKLEIHVDRYPSRTDRTDDFCRYLKKHKIPFCVTDSSEWRWKDLGLPGLKEQTAAITRKRFRNCWNKKCFTLAHGFFSCCPRGITTCEVFGQKQNQYDCFNINKTNLLETKVGIAVSMNKFITKDFCRYCLGMSNRNTSSVLPGEQLQRSGNDGKRL